MASSLFVSLVVFPVLTSIKIISNSSYFSSSNPLNAIKSIGVPKNLKSFGLILWISNKSKGDKCSPTFPKTVDLDLFKASSLIFFSSFFFHSKNLFLKSL